MYFYTTLLAQVRNPLFSSDYSGYNSGGWGYFNITIQNIINVGFIIAAVIFVIIFIVGAFQWITAGGDKGKLSEAKGKITHVIIGLIVLLLIFLIIQFVNYVLGINIGMFGAPPGNNRTAYDFTPGATLPIATSTLTVVLTNTPVPTSTPTGTPVPTRVPTSTPTNVPIPTSTNTPIPTSTNTPVPTRVPTSTPTNVPIPTSTPLPTVTPILAFCSDTDTGVDSENIGTVAENSSSGVVQYHTDFCYSLSSLNEYFCSSSTNYSSTLISCSDIRANSACQNGECCSVPNTACLTDSDCCLPYVCNSGRCQSSGNILLNQAASVSCRNYCLDSGFSGCSSIGTDTAGTNGMATLYQSGSCVTTNTYDCFTVLYNQGVVCSGFLANWTYCRCF